ncbi:MAG: tetratricopeptide repeat protein [Planctomycetota bacterium]
MPRRSRLLALFLIALVAGCASSPVDTSAALSQRRDDAIKLAVRGKAAYDAGKLESSIELYSKSIETYGEIPGVRTNLGVALLDHKDLMQAADTLKAEVQLFPAASEQALTNLGVIYADKGWAKEALEYFRRALELAPRDPVALRGAIETMMNTNAPEQDTLELVKRAVLVERDPKLLIHYRWIQIGLETTIKDRPKYGNASKPNAQDTSPRLAPRKNATPPGTEQPATTPSPAPEPTPEPAPEPVPETAPSPQTPPKL